MVDEASGPTFIPDPVDIDADRRAWEDEQVPYDDAAIAAYEEDDLPPFDMPFDEVTTAAAPVPTTPAPVPSPVSPTVPTPPASPDVPAVPVTRAPQAAAAAPTPSQAPTAPAASDTPFVEGPAVPFSTSSPFANATASTEVPHTKEEAQELLNSVFGAGVVLKGPNEG